MRDFTYPLWLLKLGALGNLYFLASTFAPHAAAAGAQVLVAARVFFAVSAYRCLFPVRYEDNVVFHDLPASSIFVTRLLATFSEVAYVYLFSHVLRSLNGDGATCVDALSWAMVVQVVIAQGFVWGAILSERRVLYFYEELGWAVIFVINTSASGYLRTRAQGPLDAKLLELSMWFGAIYLPWQLLHLRALYAAARNSSTSGTSLHDGLRRALFVRNRRRDAGSWGGWIGLSWMAGYWAVLIPLWMNEIVNAFLARG